MDAKDALADALLRRLSEPQPDQPRLGPIGAPTVDSTGGPSPVLTPLGRGIMGVLDAGAEQAGRIPVEVAKGAWNGFTAPGRALKGALQVIDPDGHVTDEAMHAALDMAGLTMMGGLGGAPAGAGEVVTAGIKRPVSPALPMDEAARMARAREMGFRTDMPLYHGTAAEDFAGFSLNPPMRTAAGSLPESGVFASLDPAYASEFAARSAELGAGPGPRVLPLLHRTNSPARLDAAQANSMEIAGAVRDAWEAGHDAVMLQNYTRGARGPVEPTSLIVVRDPAQLRSPFAAFDPAKRNSTDLLASFGAFGAPALGAIATGSPAPDR